MADVASDRARRAIASVDAPFVVRMDVPHDLYEPETEAYVMAAQNLNECADLVIESLAERELVAGTNIQIRIWRTRQTDRQLIFDHMTLEQSVAPLMAELIRSPSLDPLPPLTAEAEEHRRAFGGPFDTDHALALAILNRSR